MARKTPFQIAFLYTLAAAVFCLTPFAYTQDYLTEAEFSDEMLLRLEQLEADSATLRGELARLKQQNGSITQAAPSTTSASDYITHQELSNAIQKEVEQNAWRRGEFRITPYGRIWASLIGATNQHAPEDAVMWIQPEDTHGEETCTLTARRSRFGIWMDGPDLCFWGMGVQTAGKVEIDFMGGINPTHNKPGVQLREVYWKMENDDFMFLVGQTKDVVSPLTPNALNYAILWNAGNIGYRNPQFRLERYHYLSQCVKMEVQMALCQMFGSDLPNIDYAPGFPTFQARVGWEIHRCWNPYPIRFGFSGHYGQQGYTLINGNREIDSWSVNFDLHVPITERFGFQGEFFHGQGLAGLAGGVEQSLDYQPIAGDIGTLKSIHSTGGWGEIWWDMTERLHWAVGSGIDNPHDADMSVAPRRSNTVLYANLVYDITDYLRTGIEYSYWRTKYNNGENATASVIEWTWQFNF